MSLLSERQLAANRRNAPLSKGTMSEEGKAAVRHNALRHGLTTDQVVLSDEDPAAFAAMRDALIKDHAPANEQEADLVDQIAANYWRLLRAQRVETELFESAMHPKAPRRSSRETMEIHEPFAQAFCNHMQHFETLRRYTASIERAYYRSLETLRKFQSSRRTPAADLTPRTINTLGTVSYSASPAESSAPVSSLQDVRLAGIAPLMSTFGTVSQTAPPVPTNFPENSAASSALP
jgi:hypothetical protein